VVTTPNPGRSNRNGRYGRHDRGPHTGARIIGERRVDGQRSRHKDHRGGVEEHDGRVRAGHTIRTDEARVSDFRQALQTDAEVVT